MPLAYTGGIDHAFLMPGLRDRTISRQTSYDAIALIDLERGGLYAYY